MTQDGTEWELVASHLDALLGGPTDSQLETAQLLDVDLPASVPTNVAAVILRWHLRDALGLSFRTVNSVPKVLGDIEDELTVDRTTDLITGTREELSAWFEARYTLKTVRGLRELKPEVGDIVSSGGWREGERRVISSISDNGRINMKGRPARGAWPNHLQIVARNTDPGYAAAVDAVANTLLDGYVSSSTKMDNYAKLLPYALEATAPDYQTVRELEELLDSGEPREEPFQQLLTRHPELLATTVVGGAFTFVIPKPGLGGKYVPDFLVLGINSVGPQWTAVEIEGARHPIHTKKMRLTYQARHAMDQIEDWREWLTMHASYAQIEAGFHGLTSHVPGLVIIGRDDPRPERQVARARSEEAGGNIAVHSWDWLLRAAKNRAEFPLYTTSFARSGLRTPGGQPALSLPRSSAMTFEELFEDMDLDDDNQLPWQR